jgi:uracil-DNA glycosylase family 4
MLRRRPKTSITDPEGGQNTFGRRRPPPELPLPEPPRDCPLCPRLVAFRGAARALHPEWHNAPVPSLGDGSARLLIVGLAPGLKGANRTGRPFTGDYAGDLLYATLLDYGFATGVYEARRDDTLVMRDALISNAVRCVPPANKPEPSEITTCRQFLIRTMHALPNLRAILALGRIAHDSVVRAFGEPLARFAFGHGTEHLALRDSKRLVLFDSYHCSRYNTNTGVLTPDMFRAVFARIRDYLDASA